METCVRGFSYMSDSKVQLADLQFIEGGELERAWRTSRRERIKQREQKIWDEFVKENDIIKGVYNDDPYQFLDQLPESCLKEIMDKELKKMKKETAQEQARAQENALKQLQEPVDQKGNGDNSPVEENQHPCVTFADEVEKDDCDMFHIFDDDPSVLNSSGPEEDTQNDPGSPTTVREKPKEILAQLQSGQLSPDRLESSIENIPESSVKSTENVTNLIESSIYCAKVKDLRIKINEELMAIMVCLDRRDILSAAPEDIGRMIKRSAEFCTRFNRIYMYQLQRQMHDIKRNINNNMSLPFAKHTQFQSQMVRIVSLHQNLLQSFQVFHKSVVSECMVREGAGAMRALLAAARDVSALCGAVPRPKDFAAAADLYNDELLQTCDRLEQFAHEYSLKCEDYLKSLDRMMGSHKKTAKHKGKKRTFGAWTRNTPKNTAAENDANLSMYSFDTLRLNLNSKSSSSKDNQSSHNSKKTGLSTSGNTSKQGEKQQKDKISQTPKSQTKSPRQSRRPLMRDPHAGRPRPPRPTRDPDIRTMVEAVAPCASSHISRENSPKVSRPARPGVLHTPRASPSRRAGQHAPGAAHGTGAAHAAHTAAVQAAHAQLNSPHNPRNALVPGPRKVQNPRVNENKPEGRLSARSNRQLRRALSSIKSDQTVTDTQMTPVCKIQCAMKKDLDDDKHGGHSRHEMSTSPKEKQEEREESYEKEAKEKEMRERKERERNKMSTMSPDRCEVTRLIKQLCSGDASGTDRISGAKNAQLLYVNGSSPRQPSTPQLLRILEETIQKKVPKPLYHKPSSARGPDRYRLTFNITEKTADNLFQYRTKFVQHMLTSALYANSAVGKPWEMIGSISEQIIDELLLSCTKEMELRELLQTLFQKETK